MARDIHRAVRIEQACQARADERSERVFADRCERVCGQQPRGIGSSRQQRLVVVVQQLGDSRAVVAQLGRGNPMDIRERLGTVEPEQAGQLGGLGAAFGGGAHAPRARRTAPRSGHGMCLNASSSDVASSRRRRRSAALVWALSSAARSLSSDGGGSGRRSAGRGIDCGRPGHPRDGTGAPWPLRCLPRRERKASSARVARS